MQHNVSIPFFPHSSKVKKCCQRSMKERSIPVHWWGHGTRGTESKIRLVGDRCMTETWCVLATGSWARWPSGCQAKSRKQKRTEESCQGLQKLIWQNPKLCRVLLFSIPTKNPPHILKGHQLGLEPSIVMLNSFQLPIELSPVVLALLEGWFRCLFPMELPGLEAGNLSHRSFSGSFPSNVMGCTRRDKRS